MLSDVIDPDSAVPPYEQVAKMLRDEIAQGAMTGRVPSVHTIAEHHHVSHRVAARALEILKEDLHRTLRLLGCPSISALDRSYVNSGTDV